MGNKYACLIEYISVQVVLPVSFIFFLKVCYSYDILLEIYHIRMNTHGVNCVFISCLHPQLNLLKLPCLKWHRKNMQVCGFFPLFFILLVVFLFLWALLKLFIKLSPVICGLGLDLVVWQVLTPSHCLIFREVPGWTTGRVMQGLRPTLLLLLHKWHMQTLQIWWMRWQ